MSQHTKTLRRYHHRQQQQQQHEQQPGDTITCARQRRTSRTHRVNLLVGINDLAFSIGDDSIADFVSSIQFLPVVQMVR